MNRWLMRRDNATRSSARYRRSGAAVVELAVVAPVFFLLLFGLVELGRTLMVKHALTEAARAGCREAILSTTIDVDDADQAARQHLVAYLSGAKDGATCRVSISPSDLSEVQRGDEITAIVEVDCDDISWITPSFTKNRIIRGEVTMKRE
jgi:Flp pilus assembly protein TadG